MKKKLLMMLTMSTILLAGCANNNTYNSVGTNGITNNEQNIQETSIENEETVKEKENKITLVTVDRFKEYYEISEDYPVPDLFIFEFINYYNLAEEGFEIADWKTGLEQSFDNRDEFEKDILNNVENTALQYFTIVDISEINRITLDYAKETDEGFVTGMKNIDVSENFINACIASLDDKTINNYWMKFTIETDKGTFNYQTCSSILEHYIED